MEEKESLKSVAGFVSEYAVTLMGSGVHTSRVVRNCIRIAASFGYDVNIGIFSRTIILSVTDKETGETYSEVAYIQLMPTSFEYNADLSALSWRIYDERMSMREIWDEYRRIIGKPRMSPSLVLLLAGLANASFCRLFGGDWISMGIVFIATVCGFYLRRRLHSRLNNYINVILSAFVASVVSSLSLLFDTTSEIALATSVLYLIPGVPLINSVIDIVEGHTITGFSRLVNASLIIVCIAIGMSITLLIVKDGLI